MWLPVSVSFFDFFVVLFYPFSISVFKEINQVFQDVDSFEENALMNQSVAILINTIFQLINLLQLQAGTYLYKCIMWLLPTIVLVVNEVGQLCLFHMENLELLLLLHHQLLHHHLLVLLLIILHLLLLELNTTTYWHLLLLSCIDVTWRLFNGLRSSVEIVNWSGFYLIRQ